MTHIMITISGNQTGEVTRRKARSKGRFQRGNRATAVQSEKVAPRAPRSLRCMPAEREKVVGGIIVLVIGGCMGAKYQASRKDWKIRKRTAERTVAR